MGDPAPASAPTALDLAAMDPEDRARRFPSREAFLALRGGLTLRQRAFCEAYLGRANGNAAEAARLAGYAVSETNGANLAHKVLNSPKVVAYIERKLKRRMVMGATETLSELSKVGRVKVPISERGKLKALELMAKHHRLVEEAAINMQQTTVVTAFQLQQKIDGYAGALRSATVTLTPPSSVNSSSSPSENDESVDTSSST